MRLRFLTSLAVAAALVGCASAPKTAAAPTYVDVARFRAIVVESVHIAPTATTLNEADRKAIEHKLHYALIDAIPASARAAQPGEGVLQVKIVVTQLDAANPGVNAVSSTLIKVPLDRGSIAFDATFFDRPGGAAIGSTTVRQKGKMLDFKGNFSRYGAAVGAVRDWAASFAGSLARS
jgi:hypothetical protein